MSPPVSRGRMPEPAMARPSGNPAPAPPGRPRPHRGEPKGEGRTGGYPDPTPNPTPRPPGTRPPSYGCGGVRGAASRGYDTSLRAGHSPAIGFVTIGFVTNPTLAAPAAPPLCACAMRSRAASSSAVCGVAATASPAAASSARTRASSLHTEDTFLTQGCWVRGSAAFLVRISGLDFPAFGWRLKIRVDLRIWGSSPAKKTKFQAQGFLAYDLGIRIGT